MGDGFTRQDVAAYAGLYEAEVFGNSSAPEEEQSEEDAKGTEESSEEEVTEETADVSDDASEDTSSDDTSSEGDTTEVTETPNDEQITAVNEEGEEEVLNEEEIAAQKQRLPSLESDPSGNDPAPEAVPAPQAKLDPEPEEPKRGRRRRK